MGEFWYYYLVPSFSVAILDQYYNSCINFELLLKDPVIVLREGPSLIIVT